MADVFTKGLGKNLHWLFVSKMGMKVRESYKPLEVEVTKKVV